MTTEPTTPKPRRRWWQFSLRTFFVLLTVFCVLLGWTVHRANDQRKVVAWVREMGGTVRYDYDVEGNPFADSEPPGPKWLVDLVGVDYFQEVTVVNLYKTEVSDLTALAKLTSLERLYLHDTNISDLTPLANLINLQELVLNNTQTSDLTALAKLTSLRRLLFDNTPVSDLTPLAKLTNLETLWLDGKQVSDLTPLAGLKNLGDLILDTAPVSEEQVEELRQALPNCNIEWSPPDPSP